MNHGNKRLTDYPLGELKRIYVTLHAALRHNPALMDCDLLEDLQLLLQRKAAEAHVDATDHAAWDRWLHAPADPVALP